MSSPPSHYRQALIAPLVSWLSHDANEGMSRIEGASENMDEAHSWGMLPCAAEKCRVRLLGGLHILWTNQSGAPQAVPSKGAL